MLSSMRALPLLLCLSLGACAGGVSLPSGDAALLDPKPAASPPPPPAATPPQRSGRTVSGSTSGGARGGAVTAAARAPAEPVDPGVDPLIQARSECWMKVETNKSLRNIDQRVAFVDKCVADRMKGAN